MSLISLQELSDHAVYADLEAFCGGKGGARGRCKSGSAAEADHLAKKAEAVAVKARKMAGLAQQAQAKAAAAGAKVAGPGKKPAAVKPAGPGRKPATPKPAGKPRGTAPKVNAAAIPAQPAAVQSLAARGVAAVQGAMAKLPPIPDNVKAVATGLVTHWLNKAADALVARLTGVATPAPGAGPAPAAPVAPTSGGVGKVAAVVGGAVAAGTAAVAAGAAGSAAAAVARTAISAVVHAAVGAGSGAMTGAGIGAFAGPIGAVVGTALGGTVGAITGAGVFLSKTLGSLFGGKHAEPLQPLTPQSALALTLAPLAALPAPASMQGVTPEAIAAVKAQLPELLQDLFSQWDEAAEKLYGGTTVSMRSYAERWSDEAMYGELVRFCGGHGGKPGVCEGGHGKEPAKPKPTLKESLDAYQKAGVVGKAGIGLGLTKDAVVGALGKAGAAIMARLPAQMQVAILTTIDGAKSIVHSLEHYPEAAFKGIQKTALDLARARGLNEEQVGRLQTVLKTADAVAANVTNIPIVHHLVESMELLSGGAAFAAAKVGYYTPVASLAHIGYSSAMIAGAAVQATAMRVVGAITGRVRSSTVALGAGHAERFAAATSDDHMADATLVADAMQAHQWSPWYEAMLYAALDFTHYNIAQAVQLANQGFTANPQPVHAPGSLGAALQQIGQTDQPPAKHSEQFREDFQRYSELCRFQRPG